MVSRLNSKPSSTGSSGQYSSTDFDLWPLMLLLQSYQHILVTAKWVKSHQDDKRAIGNLSTNEAKLNVLLTDSIATNIYKVQRSLPP